MDNTKSNENNGLITKIWGPAAWKYLHSVAFGYPVKPDDKQKKDYMEFFMLVGHTMPCGACRESYREFIKTKDTILDMKVMLNRETLTRWLFRVHNRVNVKLKHEYGLKYDNVKDRYESYRAGNKQGQCGGAKVKRYRLVKN